MAPTNRRWWWTAVRWRSTSPAPWSHPPARPPSPTPEGPPAFPDVPGENGAWAWCLKHVEYLADEGLVEGYEDGLYHPEYAVTRDHIAVIITRAFELINGFGFRYVP